MSAQETTTTLTDLLNSLHRHLKDQIQLLPTLHLQLGLSPSALEDDFRALHAELVKGVERPVEARQKEVEEWMTRCDMVEHECMRYSKALGENVQSSSNTIEELRNDLVLPRRYNLVMERQEKLRQVSVLEFVLETQVIIILISALPLESRAIGDTYEPVALTRTDFEPNIF